MMSNFDLKIIPCSQTFAVIADSAFGEAAIQLNSPDLAKAVADSNRLRTLFLKSLSSPEEPTEPKTIEFGEHLFALVFQGEILDLFNRTIGGSRTGKLNIRLMLGKPELNSIHWEVMRFRNEYVGFRHNLFRHPFVLRPLRVPEKQGKVINVLHVAVDPLYGDETIVEERTNFLEIFKGFGEQVRVTSLFQEDARVDNIVDALLSGVDIWHFTGHGLFNEHNHLESALIVWPGHPAEKYGKISVRALRTLATSRSLGFCFLNGCDTGRNSTTVPEGDETSSKYLVNMAHSLIEAGIPMVIATNHVITVSAATALSRRFYKSIVKYGRRVDQAVSEARAELYLGGPGITTSDWSCPILYTRSRFNELGTEGLHWEASDIYTIRNIERPTYAEARARDRT